MLVEETIKVDDLSWDDLRTIINNARQAGRQAAWTIASMNQLPPDDADTTILTNTLGDQHESLDE